MQQDEEEDQEWAGWRVHGPEKDGDKRMERQSKEPRDLEAYCSGGQGPPRAVAPTDDDDDEHHEIWDGVDTWKGIEMRKKFWWETRKEKKTKT